MASLDNSNDESGILSAINITPFVDVVLVLLVIFMITAPMLVKDILELKLPKAANADGSKLETLGIAINRDGNILINGALADEEALKRTAASALEKNADAQAIISADQDVAYGRVVKVIDLLKTAGLHRFAVQIEKSNP